MSRYQSVFDALSPFATVLTPNHRLATYLRNQYNEAQKNPVFNSPDILPLTAWLKRLYETALTQQWICKFRLTKEQELVLWEQVINTEPGLSPLLSKSNKTAQLTQKAWELMQHWQLPVSVLEHSHHGETEQFLIWLKKFKHTLATKDWLTEAELPAYLLDYVPISYYPTLPTLHLVGFDDITPLMQQFWATLEQRGAKINTVAVGGDRASNAIAEKLGCKNSLEELNLALSFAKKALERNKHARIGIVVPELGQQRSSVVALCQKLFYADFFFQEPEANSLVNISGGTPLINTLLLSSIFTALKLKSHRIGLPDLYWLWHSPYFDFGAHNAARPLWEHRLARQHNKYISHHSLMRFLEQQLSLENKKDADIPHFYQALNAPPSHNPEFQSHHTWVQNIHRYLLALGFPGQRTLVSSDVQRLQAFEDVLRSFASLDTIENLISFETALTQLQSLCQQKLFQAKTDDAPIQVLGLLEASGQEYTHLWITGLNEGILPSNPHPQPLLPVQLQKQLAMPHADSAREFDFSEKWLARLLAHSEMTIGSYSQKSDDINLSPSPLIRAWPLFNKSDWFFAVEEQKPSPLKIDYINDDQGLAIPTDTFVRGGSSLFKLQAQCPFKAYAHLRLQVEENAPPGLGLSPSLRGSMVHNALHYFYQNIHSQSELLALSKLDQHEHLQQACQKALTHLHKQHPPLEYGRHYALELARLEKLLSAWLEQEKIRPHFRILATEKSLDVDFADLKFTVQIDRIDRLDDGSQIIIDYKTGEAHISDWFSERPNEPQMPLYCSVYDSDIKAMAFAKVKIQKISLDGIGSITENWPAIKRLTLNVEKGTDPWEQQKMLWREQLTLLANEFKQGYAAVNPKDGEKSCQYCQLPSLCRVRLNHSTRSEE